VNFLEAQPSTMGLSRALTSINFIFVWDSERIIANLSESHLT